MPTFDFKSIDNINEYLDNELYNITGKTKQKPTEKNKSVLIMSGGGVRGIAHIGAIKALQDIDMLKYIKTICGTSVGALIGFLHNIGYSPDELYKFSIMLGFEKLVQVASAPSGAPSEIFDRVASENNRLNLPDLAPGPGLVRH